MVFGFERLLFALDHQHTVFHPGIFQPGAGVILALMIPHKALFITPLGRIRQPLVIKFIRPDQFPVPGSHASRGGQ